MRTKHVAIAVVSALVGVTVTLLTLMLLKQRSVSRFVHLLPKERYDDLVKEFGEPSILVNEAGGLAIWYHPAFYTQIVLKDESIEHDKPKPHCDFLYATVNVVVPFELVPLLLQISDSINYDNLKKELTARCHFMGANVATLWLAMRTLQDPANAAEYRSSYGPTIMATMDPAVYRQMVQELAQMVQQNQQANANQMPNRNCYIKA